MKGRITQALIVLVGVAILTPPPLYGYIDPLSGSIILQVVAAGILGATITVKRFWSNIRDFFRRSERIDGERPEA